MQKQGSTTLAPVPRPPWSPVLVTLIAFLLPPGGAVLAVRSLARMRETDQRRTARETAIVVIVFSIGYGSLMTLTLLQGRTAEDGSTGISMLVSVGTALACYLMLRPAYAVWRRAHATVPLSSWMSAAGNAIFFTLVTVVGVVLVGLLSALVVTVAGWPAYWLPKR